MSEEQGTESLSLNDKVVTAKEVDWSPKELDAPVYEKIQILQDVGGSNATLSANSTTRVSFTLSGGDAWNLSRSDIVFDLLTTNTNVGGAVKGTTLFTDSLPIDSIIGQCVSSNPLVNIQSAQIYSKVSQFLTLPMDEYLSRGPVWGDVAIGTNTPVGENFGCQPCSCLIGDQASAVTLPRIPSAAYIVNALTVNVVPATAISGVDRQFIFPQRLVSGVYADPPANPAQNLTLRYRIKLSAFSGTIFAVNKSIYWGKNFQIIIQLKAISNWGFSSETSLTVPASAPQSFSTGVLSNLYFYGAQEQNEYILQKLKAAVGTSSGMELYVPYTYCSQITAGGAGTFAVPVTLNEGDGMRLKRIITVPCLTANNLTSTANNDNVNSAKFTQFQSFLRGKPLQAQILVVNNSDMWNFAYPLVKNSPAGISERNYLINNFWCDNFSDANEGPSMIENDCLLSGLKVDGSISYSAKFFAATAAFTYYWYVVYVRRLVISSRGANFEDLKI